MFALFLTLIGLAAVLIGVCLWLGLPATLIVFGLVCLYAAVRLEMTDETIATHDSDPIP